MSTDVVTEDGDECIAGAALSVSLSHEGDRRVIHLGGELDRATRDEFLEVCTAEPEAAIVLDFGDVTFMDCAGYSSLLRIRQSAESSGRTLSVRNLVGQPGHLLALVSQLEAAGGTP